MNKQDYILENGELVIKEGVESIGDWAFDNNQITNLTIPNSVGSIGNWAFNRNKITNLTIPNSVKSIKSGVFANNHITNLTIPDSVECIKNGAFANNYITNLIIPNTIRSIGDYVFYNNKIEHLTLPDNINTVKHNIFNKNPLKTLTFKGVTYDIIIPKNLYLILIIKLFNPNDLNSTRECYVFNGIHDNKLSVTLCDKKILKELTSEGITIQEKINKLTQPQPSMKEEQKPREISYKEMLISLLDKELINHLDTITKFNLDDRLKTYSNYVDIIQYKIHNSAYDNSTEYELLTDLNNRFTKKIELLNKLKEINLLN